MSWFDRVSNSVVKWAGSASALSVAVAITIIWALSGPIFKYSDTWQITINTGTTIVTFWMVFIIQHSQNKESAAVQAKLDELVLAVSNARNELVGLDLRTEQEIEDIRHTQTESPKG